MLRPIRFAGLAILLLAGAAPARDQAFPRFTPGADELAAAYARSERADGDRPRVYKARIVPHWFAGGDRFWYRNDLREGGREFVLVDASKGTRAPAFDHRRLAEALSKATGQAYAADRLPFDEIAFADEGREVQFRVGGVRWSCRLEGYACARATGEVAVAPEPSPRPQRPGNRARPSPRSPDGKWTAAVREGNLFIRDADGKETKLTTDARPGRWYALPSWSPDSKALAAFRVDAGENKEVFRIESSPKGGGRAVLQRETYPLPGDRLDSYALHLFDPATGTCVRPEVDPVDLNTPAVRWAPDGQTLTYQKVDRGHQRFRLVEVDARTGKARTLIDERSNTFIWTAHAESVGMPLVTWLTKTNELVYVSEKSGWRHLYLIDARTGRETPVTHGEWVVRGISRIDEEKRQVWFSAGGYHRGQDPYFVHHFRVNLDGTGLVPLTAGDGTHTVQHSPGGKYLIDTHSRVDRPHAHELRRAADGTLVCELDEADAADAPPTPEVFVAKGRDGKTDVWGVIYRPANFDPTRRYPVIEYVYAGPQGAFVPKAYAAGRAHRHLTELGFVVVQMDGMGTAFRSKAFHDVCWHNLKDGGLPDRILWHRAAAAKYPWYDATRVGIFGTSAGGQNAAAAVLFHGDFYKAAVAACGCHDNRMDKASWNEQWMGYPVGPHYAASSNVENAYRLKGKLLLIVGELDDNVPPESTLRLCDALVKARKEYEFLMLPGMRHSDGGPYGRRRTQDFFVRHLHGATPPDHNARPEPVPPAVRERLGLDPFYQKYLDADGLPVLGSGKVSDDALAEAAWVVKNMLAGRDDVRRAMADQKVRAVVMAASEYTTDVPEHRNLRPKLFWDRRARGLGATPRNPVVSGAEENLLGFPRDPYPNENIFLHEFAHAVHETGMNKVDPTFDRRLRAAYAAARERGLWKDTYAATNHHEYWAEGVQCWFDDNAPPDALHNEVRTRAKLKEYDPALAALCKEVFGDGAWRYVKLRDRKPEGRAHVPGYDPKALPRFRWREAPPGNRPRVVVQTAVGDFDVELDPKAAPAAVTNFLRVALDGGYHSGRFHRTTGGGAWATVAPQWGEKWAKDLALEDVAATKGAPGDGTIALVRERHGWVGLVVFAGEKVDAGGAEVVPIGRVTKGADVVQKIIARPNKDGNLVAPVEIRRVIRAE